MFPLVGTRKFSNYLVVSAHFDGHGLEADNGHCLNSLRSCCCFVIHMRRNMIPDCFLSSTSFSFCMPFSAFLPLRYVQRRGCNISLFLPLVPPTILLTYPQKVRVSLVNPNHRFPDYRSILMKVDGHDHAFLMSCHGFMYTAGTLPGFSSMVPWSSSGVMPHFPVPRTSRHGLPHTHGYAPRQLCHGFQRAINSHFITSLHF